MHPAPFGFESVPYKALLLYQCLLLLEGEGSPLNWTASLLLPLASVDLVSSPHPGMAAIGMTSS